MELTQGQRDVLRSKLEARARGFNDDCLVAFLILSGYSMDQIDQFLREFN